MKEILIECIREGLDEAGEKVSDAGVEILAGWIEGLYDNLELVCGPVENPLIHQMKEKEISHKKQVEAIEEADQILRMSIRDMPSWAVKNVHIEDGKIAYSRSRDNG